MNSSCLLLLPPVPSSLPLCRRPTASSAGGSDVALQSPSVCRWCGSAPTGPSDGGSSAWRASSCTVATILAHPVWATAYGPCRQWAWGRGGAMPRTSGWGKGDCDGTKTFLMEIRRTCSVGGTAQRRPRCLHRPHHASYLHPRPLTYFLRSSCPTHRRGLGQCQSAERSNNHHHRHHWHQQPSHQRKASPKSISGTLHRREPHKSVVGQ